MIGRSETGTPIMIAHSAIDQLLTPRRRPGRPRTDESGEQRDLHISVAEDRFIRGQLVPSIAERLGVTRRTVQLWINRALGYPEGRHLLAYADPRSAALRCPSPN
jgi:hypothetical protein